MCYQDTFGDDGFREYYERNNTSLEVSYRQDGNIYSVKEKTDPKIPRWCPSDKKLKRGIEINKDLGKKIDWILSNANNQQEVEDRFSGTGIAVNHIHDEFVEDAE